MEKYQFFLKVSLAFYIFFFGEGASLEDGLAEQLQTTIEGGGFMLIIQKNQSVTTPEDSTEAIMHIFKGKRTLSVIEDRTKKQRQVFLEVAEGTIANQYYAEQYLDDDLSIQSLILKMDQKESGTSISLYINCILHNSAYLPESIKYLFNLDDDSDIKLYVADGYNIRIKNEGDSDVPLNEKNCSKDALDSGGLEVTPVHIRRTVRDYPDISDNRIDQIPLQSNIYGYGGDGTIAALNRLITATNYVLRRVEEHQAVTHELKRLIEECKLCKQGPCPITVPTCQTHPPRCYPGVRCHDTAKGPRCGTCPEGMTGDGYNCRQRDTCSPPCYSNVRCYQTTTGPRCGPCPNGMTGNGYQCRPLRSCSDIRCYPSVQCYEMSSGARCGPCPAGMTGDGVSCRPHNTCSSVRCYPGVRCYETSSGPRCGPCPSGMTGDGYSCRYQRSCSSVRCHPGAQCYETSSGPRCGPCPSGYTGDGYVCVPSDYRT